jgi:hypothetical protein
MRNVPPAKLSHFSMQNLLSSGTPVEICLTGYFVVVFLYVSLFIFFAFNKGGSFA